MLNKNAVRLPTKHEENWVHQAPEAKVLWTLSYPLIPGLVAFLMVDFIESSLVFHSSKWAASILSQTIPATSLLFALAIGLSIAVVARLNQVRVHATQHVFNESVQCHLQWSLAVALIASSLALVLYAQNLLAGPSLNSAGMDWSVTSANSSYLLLRILAYPSWLLVFVCLAIFRVLCQPHLAGKVLVGWSVAKILASVLAYGLTPKDVSGSSILDVMAFGHLCVDSAFSLYCARKLSLLIAGGGFVRWRWNDLVRLLKIACPASLHGLLNSVMLAGVSLLVLDFGQQALAVYGLVLRMEMFLLFVPMLLTMSFPVFAGQNWARGDYKKVLRQFKRCSAMIFLAQLLIYFGLLALVQGFNPSVDAFNPELRNYLLFVPASYGFLGVSFLVVSTLNAVGFSIKALWVTSARVFAFYLPCVYVGILTSGLCGFFTGMFIANILSGAFSYLYALYHLNLKTRI